jgi:hypothetical protein
MMYLQNRPFFPVEANVISSLPNIPENGHHSAYLSVRCVPVNNRRKSFLYSILFKWKQRGAQRGFGREPNRPCKRAVEKQM